ncbi:UvrD-helicase domain-containing protein [Kribbella antibiotica]|uniref:UvrD-helicase domain-containing protein n=1 Tax=Kribbella antibiotica TaxID=190195 RepID=UPI00192D8E2E|nr:UvrD-helicase domain-containing protein [Kribbella antibiotica]
MPFKHDHYLKMWALTRPQIPGEFLLLDEAQDPAVERVFLDQGRHAQLVMVGDSAQAIYGWRGARDVMTGFGGRQLALSQVFPIRLGNRDRGLPAADDRRGPDPSVRQPNGNPLPSHRQ